MEDRNYMLLVNVRVDPHNFEEAHFINMIKHIRGILISLHSRHPMKKAMHIINLLIIQYMYKSFIDVFYPK